MAKKAPVVVLGLGTYTHGSGTEAAAYLARQGERVIVTDLKPPHKLNQKTLRRLRRLEVQLVLGRHRMADIRAARQIVRNPAVPSSSPYLQAARKLKKPVTNDVGLFLDALRKKFPSGTVTVIAITGTRGKSTTTALIGHILEQTYGRSRVHVGGNIGRSPLSFLHRIKMGDIVVLELSSWLLHDLVRPAFHIAVFLNFLPDHLDYYRTMKEYQKDKERIFLGQTASDVAVLNLYDQKVAKMAKRTRAKIRWFGPKDVRDCALRGDHNALNVGAAWESGKSVGISDRVLRQAIRTFHPLPNRLEEVRRFRGRLFINDTTATSQDAAIAALRSFTQPIILIAGGNTKGLSLMRLRQAIRRRVRKLIVLPGNATAQFPSGIVVRTMEEAVRAAWQYSRPGDVILLSPGVTWLPVMNEFERGKRFVIAVRRLH